MYRHLAIALLLSANPLAHASDACTEAYQREATAESFLACRQSAESGNPDAEFGYGLVLWSGYGRQPEPRESIEWLRRAAKQGHRLARVSLGRFLTDAQAPPEIRNRSEGYAWWLAAGEMDAASDLKRHLTAEELANGELLGKEFAARYGPPR